MTKNRVVKKLEEIGACLEAREWAAKQKPKDLDQLWARSNRPDWMAWLLARMEGTPGWPNKKNIVRAFLPYLEASDRASFRRWLNKKGGIPHISSGLGGHLASFVRYRTKTHTKEWPARGHAYIKHALILADPKRTEAERAEILRGMLDIGIL